MRMILTRLTGIILVVVIFCTVSIPFGPRTKEPLTINGEDKVYFLPGRIHTPHGDIYAAYQRHPGSIIVMLGHFDSDMADVGNDEPMLAWRISTLTLRSSAS